MAQEHPIAEVPDSLDDVYAVSKDLVRAVESALDKDNGAAASALLEALKPADLADLFNMLARDDRRQLAALFGSGLDPDVLVDLDGTVLEDVLDALAPEVIATAIEELESDDALELIDTLDEERRRNVLAAVPAPDRAAVLEGLSFPEDSAGRLMQRELIAVPAYWTVGQVIDYCRDTEDLPDDFYEVFVVDPRHRPIGEVTLNRILRAKRPRLMREVMDDDIVAIPLDMDQEEVAFLFQHHGWVSAPVVDDVGRLVGVITFDDVTDVVEEEAEEDLLRLGGVSGEGDILEPALRTTRGRFGWLLVNLGTAIGASLVIAIFDGSIQQIVALAILMPIVASMGGNAATQTLTVAVRALATRELTSANALRIVFKEIIVGGLNGALFALLVGLLAGFWFDDPALGLVIAAAMAVNMLVAGLAGAVVPLGLARVGADPAVAATVFVTTITDVIGFATFLGLATLFLL